LRPMDLTQLIRLIEANALAAAAWTWPQRKLGSGPEGEVRLKN
jgi:hypothetical protein